MSRSTDLTSKIKIIIEIDDPGPGMKRLAEDITGAKVAIGEMTIVQNKYATSATSTGTSVRRLLLDLRMFSFGVRTLRREFGDTNPAIEAMSQALLVLAASGTMVVSGLSLITGVSKKLPFIQLVFQTVAFAAKTTLAAASITMLAAGATLLIAIPLLGWIRDQTSGMATLRREAKDLAADLRVLGAEIDSLTRSQDRFNLGMSSLSLQMQKLKQAIDLQESGTEAMEARYAALSAEYANARLEASEYALVLQELNIAEKEGAALAEDLERRKRAKQLARNWMGVGGIISEEDIFRAMQREGITEGRPSMTSINAVREQNAQGMSGGTPSVLVQFLNSVFNTEGDIEGAVTRGVERGLDRVIYNQYGVPGTQR